LDLSKFCTDKNEFTCYKFVGITTNDARYLVDRLFENCSEKEKRKYKFSDRSLNNINKYKNMYLENEWDSRKVFKKDLRSIIIFPRDDKYPSFSEGRHRIIALSEIEDESFSIDFFCAIGWPKKLKDLLRKHKSKRLFHHAIHEKAINAFDNSDGKVYVPVREILEEYDKS